MNNTHKIDTGSQVYIHPYYTIKQGRPYIEYIHGNTAGSHIVCDKGSLIYCSGFTFDGKERHVLPEYRELVNVKVVSSPHDIDGRTDMDDLYEICRDWLKTVIAFGSDLELTAATTYAIMTWFTWRNDSVPYLRFIGDYATGKTTALRALAQLCYRSLNVSGVISPAVLFRIVSAVQGTLMIDEADLRSSGLDNQLIKILNHGYTRGVAVIRLNINNEPQAFHPFGHKVIATRREFKDPSLESRCINIRMTPRSIDGLAVLNEQHVIERARVITNGLLYWRLKSASMEGDWSLYQSGDSGLPRDYAPRVRQMALPMFACTPADHRREIERYFEEANLRYLESRDNGSESQVRRILRKELYNMNHRLTLAQLYSQLTYQCRQKNSSRKISRIAESLGCEKKRTRDGVLFCFREGIV